MDAEEKALVVESLRYSVEQKERLLSSTQPLLLAANTDAARLHNECESLKRQIFLLKRAAAHLGGETT